MEMDAQSIILLLLGIIQFSFGFLFNRIFLEFEKSRNNTVILFEKMSATREMILHQQVELLKDHLEQCRKHGAGHS